MKHVEGLHTFLPSRHPLRRWCREEKLGSMKSSCWQRGHIWVLLVFLPSFLKRDFFFFYSLMWLLGDLYFSGPELHFELQSFSRNRLVMILRVSLEQNSLVARSAASHTKIHSKCSKLFFWPHVWVLLVHIIVRSRQAQYTEMHSGSELVMHAESCRKLQLDVFGQ